MKFFTEKVIELERDTKITNKVPRIFEGLKHEEIKLEIHLIGSGDTRKFSSEEIVKIIHDRLMEISPK